jgi:hypothetical protein
MSLEEPPARGGSTSGTDLVGIGSMPHASAMKLAVGPQPPGLNPGLGTAHIRPHYLPYVPTLIKY